MSKILDKMRALEIKGVERAKTFTESDFFNKPKTVSTISVPIINVAFSGTLKGGLTNGITMFAGDTGTFKTLLSLLCMKSYLDKYDDGIGVVYDTEGGITQQYLISLGIDTDRVLHIPIKIIEDLKTDMYNRLLKIDEGEHVCFIIDSLGLLASNKEAKDAQEQNTAADMTRAKEIRSFFRLVTNSLTFKNLPCIIVNHFYTEMKLYGERIVSGGKAPMLASNQVFIITRVQETEGSGSEKQIIGNTFKINVEKSRFVKKKSVLSFTVHNNKGIEKYSGLFDLAEEAGIIKKVSAQKYSLYDSEDSYKRAVIESDIEFWNKLLEDEDFNSFIEDKYMLKGKFINDENSEDDAI